MIKRIRPTIIPINTISTTKAETITHQTGAVSQVNPSLLGAYQNEHSEHLLSDACLHSVI